MPTIPASAAHAAWPHSPSLAFFLRARVPPSFPKKESSFFRDGGDLGVGDLGTEGDFCGEVAMVVERTAADRSGTRSWCWAGASGLRLRLPKRKRNYSKHLRQLTLSFPFPLSLPRAALRPAGSCVLGPLPWPGQACSLRPLAAPAERMPQICPSEGVQPYLLLCVSDPPAWQCSSLNASFPLTLHPAQILAQILGSVIAEPNPPVTVFPSVSPERLDEALAFPQIFYLHS